MTSPDQNYTSWRTDLDAAPRGKLVTSIVKTAKGDREVQSFEADPVILASKCGKVIKSRWMPEPGRWEFFNKDEQPVAWQPWPDHPEKAGKVRA